MRWPKVMFKQGENPWVSLCKQRVKANNSINAVVTGETGSGKSWATLSFARQYDPDWSLDRCYFKMSEFLQDLSDNKFKPGEFIMVDEGGVDLSSLEWQSEINKAMAPVFQTMRHRNLILFVTVPYLSFITKNVRKLVQSEFEVLGHGKNNLTKIMPRMVQYNGRLDKQYRKRLLVIKDGASAYCDFIDVPRPDNDLVKEYEKKKRDFTTDVFKRSAERLRVHEKNASGEGRRMLTPYQQQIYDQFQGGKSAQEIAAQFKVSMQTIYHTLRAIGKKGYEINYKT